MMIASAHTPTMEKYEYILWSAGNISIIVWHGSGIDLSLDSWLHNEESVSASQKAGYIIFDKNTHGKRQMNAEHEF